MTTELTRTVARLLLAPLLVLAAAVLVKGHSGAGDGFAAGVIAALAVLLQYAALGWREVERSLPVRHAPATAVAGLLVALAVATAPLPRGEPLLTHVPPAGEQAVKLGTLPLTSGVLFDAGVFLLVLGSVVAIVRALAMPAEGKEPA